MPLLRDAHGHRVEIDPEDGVVSCDGDRHAPRMIVDLERATVVWRRKEPEFRVKIERLEAATAGE